MGTLANWCWWVQLRGHGSHSELAEVEGSRRFLKVLLAEDNLVNMKVSASPPLPKSLFLPPRALHSCHACLCLCLRDLQDSLYAWKEALQSRAASELQGTKDVNNLQSKDCTPLSTCNQRVAGWEGFHHSLVNCFTGGTGYPEEDWVQ